MLEYCFAGALFAEIEMTESSAITASWKANFIDENCSYFDRQLFQAGQVSRSQKATLKYPTTRPPADRQ